jgi:hypothetical protein
LAIIHTVLILIDDCHRVHTNLITSIEWKNNNTIIKLAM